MDRDKIIKALKCCSRSGITPTFVKCSECPYHNNCNFGRNLLIDILTLINELTDDAGRASKQCDEITVEKDKGNYSSSIEI